MTPKEIIRQARLILSDNRPGNFRQEDPELLDYFNLSLREVAVFRPDLFMATGSMTCVPNRVEQSITFLDAAKFLNVLRVTNGPALTQFDMATMDRFRPNWKNDPVGQARQWAVFPNHPLRFYIYPGAPANQVIDVSFVRNPIAYRITDTVTDLPSSLMPSLVWGVVYMAESKDDEHVLSQRVDIARNRFIDILKGA